MSKSNETIQKPLIIATQYHSFDLLIWAGWNLDKITKKYKNDIKAIKKVALNMSLMQSAYKSTMTVISNGIANVLTGLGLLDL